MKSSSIALAPGGRWYLPAIARPGPPARGERERVLWVGVQFNSKEAAVEFFNLKTKRKVEIPDTELKKRR
ncbi:MAG TPA: hypothetical protein VJQ08_09525, partial [Candidatus Dormibacteraeota bacterium]|nr:hypothetical protein [Candidatus Dormibacteraeota bacterium]